MKIEVQNTSVKTNAYITV